MKRCIQIALLGRASEIADERFSVTGVSTLARTASPSHRGLASVGGVDSALARLLQTANKNLGARLVSEWASSGHESGADTLPSACRLVRELGEFPGDQI